RAMADPTRSRLLMALLEGPAYPGDLARDLDLTRSNVSNHLACLRDCGIVVAEPEGRHTRYAVADPHLTRALTALIDVTLAADLGRWPTPRAPAYSWPFWRAPPTPATSPAT